MKISGFSNFKLKQFCHQMEIVHYVKGHVLFKEGEQLSHVYFLKRGEVRVFKKRLTRQGDEDAIEESKLLLSEGAIGRNQAQLGSHTRFTQHLVETVQRGQILGLEDLLLPSRQDNFYTTSAVVSSLQAGQVHQKH